MNMTNQEKFNQNQLTINAHMENVDANLESMIHALSLRVINLESLLLMSSMGDEKQAFVQKKLRDTMEYLAPQEALTEFEVSLENAITIRKAWAQKPIAGAQRKLVKGVCKTASKERKLGLKEASLREKRERLSKK